MRRILFVLLCGLAGCSPIRGGVENDGGGPVALDLGAGPGPGHGDLRGHCEGLACQVPTCTRGATTSLVGRLLAGNGADPVPGATVYVPTYDLQEPPTGASCDLCTQIPASVASATTAFDGSFRLDGVPGGSFPLVAQLGHFRRVVSVSTAPCVENGVQADDGTSGNGIRLPRRTAELSPQDRVPRIAVVSGDYDQIECVLKRMGVEEIDVYNGRDPGTTNPPAIAEESTLLGDGAKLLGYNILVMNCTDNQYQGLLGSKQVRDNLEQFVHSGGRLYVTDWAYDAIEQVPEFAPYLCFEPQNPPHAPMCGPQSEPAEDADSRDFYSGKSQVLDMELMRWLAQFPGVIDGTGQVEVDYSFVIIAGAAGDMMHKTTVWVQGQTPRGQRPQTVTFDYNQCGRVHFSTYNTEPNGVVDDGMRWPGNCKADFSPQERLLEYLLFNVASCIGQIG